MNGMYKLGLQIRTFFFGTCVRQTEQDSNDQVFITHPLLQLDPKYLCQILTFLCGTCGSWTSYCEYQTTALSCPLMHAAYEICLLT